MALIHPTAIIDSTAELGPDVEIGPYCVVGPAVRLGAGVRLMSHAVVEAYTTVGAGCTLFPFCSVGSQTQDLKYRGGVTRAEIGERTTIREYVTINRATADGDVTRVGADCHIMAYAHVAHDCVLGDGVILANCGTLAGHVTLEDRVILGGLSAVHQFVRIGRLSIIGGCSKVTQDVPPFMTADGHPLQIRTINAIGLARNNVPDSTQRLLKAAYRMLYRSGLSTSDALEKMESELEPTAEISALIDFIRESKRGITK